MESQTDIVAAAEAVRSWVIAQRAARSAFDALPASTAPAPRSVPTPPPAPPVSWTPTPVPRPSLVPTSLADAGAAYVPAPASIQTAIPFPASPEVLPSAAPSASEATRPAARSGAWLRIAAALLVLGPLVGAGAYVWTRHVSTPGVGSVAFNSTPPGAQVVVDGIQVGETPVEVELAEGAHSVEFRTKTAKRRQAVQVKKGQHAAVAVNWNDPRYGGLQVNSTPDAAKVTVDGHERGVTPLSLTDVLVGSHTVVIESSEGTVRRKVDVSEGRTETLTEEIYSGWLRVTAPIEMAVVDNGRAVQLDDSNRVLLKPGTHNLRIENRSLDFSATRQIDIEPGGTTEVTLEVPASTLSVTGTAGSEVFVDGVKAGVIPITDYEVKLGTREIMVVAPGGETRHASVTATTKPTQLDVTFRRR